MTAELNNAALLAVTKLLIVPFLLSPSSHPLRAVLSIHQRFLSDRLAFRSMAKDKPVHEVRLGMVKAAIWKNETDTGARYNVTFARLYRDGEEWKSTDSFGRDDLLVLGKVADQAHTWIHEQGQAEEKTKEAQAPQPAQRRR